MGGTIDKKYLERQEKARISDMECRLRALTELVKEYLNNSSETNKKHCGILFTRPAFQN